MLTPRAVVRALSRLTPLMQAYWVRALRRRLAMCCGMITDGHETEGNKGASGVWEVVLMACLGDRIEGKMAMGEEEARRRKSAVREGIRGRKKGIERKWL